MKPRRPRLDAHTSPRRRAHAPLRRRGDGGASGRDARGAANKNQRATRSFVNHLVLASIIHHHASPLSHARPLTPLAPNERRRKPPRAVADEWIGLSHPDPTRARDRASPVPVHARPPPRRRARSTETRDRNTHARVPDPPERLHPSRASIPPNVSRASVARIGRASVRERAMFIRSERAFPSPHRAFDRIYSHAPIDALGLRRRRRHARARVRNRRERDRAHVVERRRSVSVGEGWRMARVCREGDSMTSRDPSCPRVVCFSRE